MFLAHFGVAMAGKSAAPRPSLGTLVLAAQFADGIWPLFVLLGLEEVRITPGITAASPLEFVWYPYTHSLAFDALWAAVVGGGYYLLRRDRRGALCLAALVLSHWALDVISHRPDVPLWPGSAVLGLGLWDSVPATLIVEAAFFFGGAWLYARATRPRDATGRWAWWSFVAILAAIYCASVFGPPPPSIQVLAWSGVAGWLFVAWGYWIERHRMVRQQS